MLRTTSLSKCPLVVKSGIAVVAFYCFACAVYKIFDCQDPEEQLRVFGSIKGNVKGVLLLRVLLQREILFNGSLFAAKVKMINQIDKFL